MSVKKGDTLYHLNTGEPTRVLRTRKLQDGDTRAYLERGQEVDIREDGTLRYNYSRVQTPELAQRWADTLRKRAEEEAERERERERRTANRIAHRDTFNSPENPTEPEHHDNSVTIQYTGVTENDDGTPELRPRFLDVSIHHTSGMEMTDKGEWSRERVACVNWWALGNVSPAVARAYAKAILLAADIAEQTPNQPDPFGRED